MLKEIIVFAGLLLCLFASSPVFVQSTKSVINGTKIGFQLQFKSVIPEELGDFTMTEVNPGADAIAYLGLDPTAEPSRSLRASHCDR